jgi:hypothetical protein
MQILGHKSLKFNKSFEELFLFQSDFYTTTKILWSFMLWVCHHQSVDKMVSDLISGFMVSMVRFVSSNTSLVKAKTMTLAFIASLLSMQH